MAADVFRKWGGFWPDSCPQPRRVSRCPAQEKMCMARVRGSSSAATGFEQGRAVVPFYGQEARMCNVGAPGQVRVGKQKQRRVARRLVDGGPLCRSYLPSRRKVSSLVGHGGYLRALVQLRLHGHCRGFRCLRRWSGKHWTRQPRPGSREQIACIRRTKNSQTAYTLSQRAMKENAATASGQQRKRLSVLSPQRFDFYSVTMGFLHFALWSWSCARELRSNMPWSATTSGVISCAAKF